MRRIVTLALAAAVAVAGQLAIGGGPANAQTTTPPTRTLESFVRDLVIRDVDAFWSQEFRAVGRAYRSPSVRLIRVAQTAPVACGGEVVKGHAYCSLDQTIYLDLGASSPVSFGSLWHANQDFAIVAIVAHEWAHYVQQLKGLSRLSGRSAEHELQADCMAGLFTRWAEGRGRLDPGDVEEGISVALGSGDAGHGTGRQRGQAFRRGYFSFSNSACGIW
jgi:predicted metalloprotease